MPDELLPTGSPLRQRAETLLKTSEADIAKMAARDIHNLVYELQVHQVELEIQNEELRVAQAALSESRDKFSDLYEFAPVGYVSLDLDGNVLSANLTICKMLQCERTALLGKPFANLVVAEDQDVYHKHRITVCTSDDYKRTCELRLRQRKDSLWTRLETTCVEHVKGDCELRVAIVDIAGRKAAEASLLDLNRTLEQRVAKQTRRIQLQAEAIAQIEEGVLITADGVDQPGPRIIFANQALCKLTGYQPDELIGQTPKLFQGEKTDRKILDDIREDLAAKRSGFYELINYRKDGTSYDVELTITPIILGDDTPVHFVSIHRDITERKKFEQTLKNREERLRTILDTAADAILTFRTNHAITGANRAMEQMFGYTSQELMGTDVTLIIPEIDDLMSKITPEAPSVSELIARTKNAQAFPVSLTISQVDHLDLFTMIVRDISEQKSLQQQLLTMVTEEQRRIGQELHDVVGQELLALGITAETLSHLIREMPVDFQANEATRLATRIGAGLNGSLKLVRELSQGLIPVEIDPLGLESALEELAGRVRVQTRVNCYFESEGQFEFDDSDTTTHLFRIAQEAVTNSLKHAKAKTIRIVLSAHEGVITLQVSDDGMGFQSDGKLVSGVGLKIMSYRAGLIGARLDIHPMESHGTCVTCKLDKTII